MTPRELAVQWRKDAETFDRYRDERMAAVLRDHAEALDAALRAVEDEKLDLTTAARESGYSADRLRHMVADGEIENAGRKGAPRIRRGDLPVKPPGARPGRGFDAASTASEVLQLPASRAS